MTRLRGVGERVGERGGEGELPAGRLGEGGPVVEGEGQAGHGGQVGAGRRDLRALRLPAPQHRAVQDVATTHD